MSQCLRLFHMMMIAFITFKSSLVPLFEGLWSSNSWEFEVSGFRRNRTDDLGIDSPSLWPTEPRAHVRSKNSLASCQRCRHSVESRALTCSFKHGDLIAWSLLSWHPTHTYLWGRLCFVHHWNGVVRFVSQEFWFDKGFVIWNFRNYAVLEFKSFSPLINW